MAKKRKAGGRRQQTASGAADDDDGKRYKMRVDNYMDVANSEDEWEHQRDKILLEDDDGPARKRQRRREEEEAALEDSAEDVFDDELSDFDENESYGVPEGEEKADSEEEEDEEDVDDSFAAKSRVASEKKRRKGSKGDEDNSSGDDDGEADQTYLEDEEGWGADDAYGADVAENEEEAREMEAEAIRLQKKRLEGLTDADFGFDEAEWLGQGEPKDDEESDGDRIVREFLPLEVSEETSIEERNRLLRVRYPEFEPLAREYKELQQLVASLKGPAEAAKRREEKRRKIRKGRDEMKSSEMSSSVIKYNSLLAYMSVLAMYFALLTSPAANANGGETTRPMDPKDLREHSVMEFLIKQRTLWEEVREWPDSEASEDESEPGTPEELADLSERSVYYTPKEESFGDRLPAEMKVAVEVTEPKKLTAVQRAVQKAMRTIQETEQAKREARKKKLDENMAQISKSMVRARKSGDSQPTDAAALENEDLDMLDNDSDFGDEVVLTAEQAAAKERRKKGLRFYTSQIAQRANRRSEAGRGDTGGGDADIPYRERLKDRQARLNAEAEARGKKKAGKGGRPDDDDDDAPGGSSSDEEDRRTAAALRKASSRVEGDSTDRQQRSYEDPDASDEEDYYQTIASRSATKSAAKSARQAALKEAALRGAEVHEVEEIGADGKRAIGYTIEKNKGLTQRRRKEVRNPRVKKRMRFEDKKKKLASMRPVYKGGEARSGYQGEMTGIKKNLAKGVRLS